MIITSWGRAVEELLACTGVTKAELAREAGIAPPVLFNYIKGHRRAPVHRVESINAAFGRIIGESNVRDYLNAVASREDLANRDARFDEDFEDVITMIASHMRAGFTDELNKHMREASMSDRRSAVDRFVIAYREKLIRHVTGKPIRETWLDTYLRIAEVELLPGRDWLKSDDEIDNARRANYFRREVEAALSETTLSVVDRLRCESRIMSAFYENQSDEARRNYAEVKNIMESAKRVGRHEGRIEILEKIQRGEPIA